MFTDIIYKAVVLMATCLALVSCSQEDGNGTDVDGDSGVHVLFRVADSPVTRETEAGWDEGWNENSVTKIVISDLPQMAR